AGQHAVTADVGVNDGIATVVFELAGEVDHIMAGELAPAIGGNLAVAGIQTHDDVAGEGTAGVAQKTGVLDCGRADDHERYATVDIPFDGVEIAYAATDLDRDVGADGVDDGTDGCLVLGRAGDSSVEIDQMQAARAGV